MSLTANPSPASPSRWRVKNAVELAEVLQENEKHIRRLQAAQGEVVAEIESRGPFAEFGYSTAAGLVQDLLRISRKEATAMVARARLLNPVHTGAVTAAPVAPLCCRSR